MTYRRVMVAIIKRKSGSKTYYYAIENKREGDKVRRSFSLYLGTAEDIIQATLAEREITLKTYEFGSIAALLSIAEELQLQEITTQALSDPEVWKALLLMIAGRFCRSLSKNATVEWRTKTILQLLWPQDAYYAEKLYRTMDVLSDTAIDQIALELAKKLLEKGLSPKILFLDPTNFFTYIEDKQLLPQKGHSKEKRSDKNLVNVAIATTQDNIPVYHQTYPGNIPDAEIFPTLIENIATQLTTLGVKTKDLVLVFDKGNNSTENIALVLGKMHLIGSVKRNQVKELMQIPLEQYDDLYTTHAENVVRGYRTEGVLFESEKPFTVVVSYNPATALRQEKTYLRAKVKILRELEQIRKKLNREGRGRKLTPEGALKQAYKLIPSQYEAIFKLKLQGEKSFAYHIDSDREKELYASFGKQALFTDLHEWSSKDIVKTYNDKYLLEDDFKAMKGALIVPLKPIYHRLDERIKAHVFLCFLGVMFYRYLLWRVKSIELSPTKVLNELEDIRVATVSNRKWKRNKIVIEKLTPKQAQIFALLKLDQYIPN